jgi:predicted PurR-regulated permease PerM
VETLAVGVVVVAALYFAREVFVPLALALLLSFALGPLVISLRRWRIGRVTSVAAAVMCASLILLGVGTLIASQLAILAGDLPQYRYNITEKIQSLRGAASGGGILGRISDTLKDLSNDIAKPTELPSKAEAPAKSLVRPGPSDELASQEQQPVPVEIRPPSPTPIEIIKAIAGPLLAPLATAGFVIVFVVFFLLQREDLRDRFIRLAGARDLNRTTRALDDAAGRLSRYLLRQSAVNASFGLLIGIGLWLIGVPNPILWGLLSMLLRFVPYIGSVIAMSFPAVVTFAVDTGWSMLIWTIGLYAVVEFVLGQVVEPILYGRTTGLSPVAIVVAAAFWTWLWGPIGLLLSTPLTLCLVVLGRHVDRLEFLNIALGDKPALSAEESFYQRMLAGDPDEAAQQAEEFLKKEALSVYYDQIAVKGLALAQLDVNRGALDHERRVQLKESVDGVIADLSDYDDVASPITVERPLLGVEQEGAHSQVLVGPGWKKDQAVLCIAGRGSLDEAVAAMLAQLLQKQGIGACIVPSREVLAANIAHFDIAGAQMACLSYLEAGGLTHARYLVRRLRRRLPNVKILLGLWTLSDEQARNLDALRETGADIIVTSLGQALSEVDKAAREEGRIRDLAQPAGEAVLDRPASEL